MNTYQRYRFDRREVPTFYTVKSEENAHNLKPGQVLTCSSDHFKPGWITVGFVSKQTPLGQGTYLGFPRSELREATTVEVLFALRQDHPHGANFHPHCREALDAQFHLVMGQTLGNWLSDGEYSHRARPINRFSSDDVREFGRAAIEEYAEMMRDWNAITFGQAAAIRDALIQAEQQEAPK